MNHFLRWCRVQWDRSLSVALFVAGWALVLIGWLGVSRVTLPTEQLPYIISGGIAGLSLVGAGMALWLSADLRDEWRKLDRIDAHLEQLIDERRSLQAPRDE